MTRTLAALVRYALVGVVNAVTYYAVYLLALREVGYLTAHVLGLGVAMIVSFFLNCRFTFRLRPSWRRFVLYPASQAVNIAATTVGVVALVTLGVDERIAPLVASVAAVPASFLAARFVLARGQRRAVVVPAAEADPATLRLRLDPLRRPVAGR
ncbi:GtrA family protein [Actinomycetospora sp. CA-084318]|uniref:GtrA family protein n=1 Tax=Actinomycetospora sp. CA-084318 TaxID=3239892 RepID=UPI003D9874CB